MSTRICFVRHGETDWNIDKRIQGHLDVGLNAMGRAQALAMGFHAAHYRFAALYSSDLTRTMDTARAIGEREGLEIRPLPQLRERNYGIFQGLTAEESATRHPEAHALYQSREPHYAFETGESLIDLTARIEQAVDWMVRHHVGQTICAVTHGGVLDIIYRKATGRPLDAPRDFPIPNCALNWIRIDEHGWHIEKWADRQHLENVLVEVAE
jgi:probable phosphoglycerate mutase